MNLRILSAFALVCALACAVVAQESKPKQAEAKVSGGEVTAAQKIQKAKGVEARLQAGAEFIKKYPQSSLRPQIAEGLAHEIADEPDAQQKVSLAQTYLEIFTLPEEAQNVNSTLLNAYIGAGKTEEAMKLGGDWLVKHPDDARTMMNLTILASTAAIKGDASYVARGREYGAKAITLLEADKMPEGYDAAKWPEFRKSSLVSLYRETGVLAHIAGDRAAARPLLEKAVTLHSPDPGVYLVLAGYAADDYDMRQKEYTVAPAAQKVAALKTAEAALDSLIEVYARAVVMTDGNAQYQQANAAIREDLEKNYKYRHNNSTEGLQQLIDKYKRPTQ
ncbi:MAG: hypothetical protein QOE46_2406 [Acidobacteriota bacterium]|jgi:hypothetical protein|nr:hypothetical protein [Acidobacteriota bacterium]